MDEKSIRNIAMSESLDEIQEETLVNLMEKRFPNESDKSYVRQWARRIKTGRAMDSADTKTARILEDGIPGLPELF